jgi:hypothetical protein
MTVIVQPYPEPLFLEDTPEMMEYIGEYTRAARQAIGETPEPDMLALPRGATAVSEYLRQLEAEGGWF